MSNGYNAFMDVKCLGKNITYSGLLGYISEFSSALCILDLHSIIRSPIAIGVDTQAEYNFTTTNYNSP